MPKLLLIVSLCCADLWGANAQTADSLLPQTGVKAALLGSLIYPGFKVGLELPYKITRIEKTKKWGEKIILKERYWTGNLGFYHHPTFHDNFFLLLEKQNRRQKRSGWFTESAIGVGYSHTFLGEETYEVSQEGLVQKKSLAGHNHAVFSMSLGGGYNFARLHHSPVKVFGKLSLLTLFPSNSFFTLRPTAEIGVVLTPANFWKSNPPLQIKKK